MRHQQEQLKEVRHLTASHRAFAALLANGRVVTWGDADSGLLLKNLRCYNKETLVFTIYPHYGILIEVP